MERRGACVAFGTFEFVHKGHLRVAERVVELANENNLEAVILSLPAEGEVYTTEKEKEYLLKEVGLDTFKTYKGEKNGKPFFSFLKEELHTTILVVGDNNSKLCEIQSEAKEYGIQVETVKTVCWDEVPITYNWLKQLFEINDFEMLAKLCGHPYTIIGDIVHGKKLGRTVGMPTINLHIYKTKKRPNCGVYATKVVLEDEIYKAATNIGRRPTVDDFEYVTIETFILDFNQQIYGEICILEVHKFLRDVKKFDSLEKVQEQVQRDVGKVQELFRKV